MRLLHVETFEFKDFLDRTKRPKYVIASHRWVGAFETTFQDVQEKRNIEGLGYKKVEDFARYVRDHVPSVEWLWIDTACIDKHSAAELSEPVNLMFRWYRNAELCLAYLPGVKTAEDLVRSDWFTRGWTLQELLAPRTVVFLDKSWQVLGNKGATAHGYCESPTGPGLEKVISQATRIPECVLHDYSTSSSLSNDTKHSWMHGRITTKDEDIFYALYGIFGVSPGANYGEGQLGAKQRLLAAINQQETLAIQKSKRSRKFYQWLSPPDPWTNHASAREQHEGRTGDWLLQSERYRRWKAGDVRHLWMYGKAGCGKTVLCSTVIEDMKICCETSLSIGLAVFYFSFSDDQKQTYESLVRSLVAQIGCKEPGMSILQKEFEQSSGNVPRVDELDRIFTKVSSAYSTTYVILDALDECPEGGGHRQKMLDRIETLAQRATNLQILATSRELRDIRESMDTIEATQIAIASHSVNADIATYVLKQISHDRRLLLLSDELRTIIGNTIAQKADGMFRWAYCQIQELKRLKSFRPSYVRNALYSLPATLDETYTRILMGIDETYRKDAIALLRWLAYSQGPRTLGELADAVLIDLENDTVDFKDRGDPESAIHILSELVTVLHSDMLQNHYELTPFGRLEKQGSSRSKSKANVAYPRPNAKFKIRLAHFSVKEFLESDRILKSRAKDFHLEPAREHRFLAQSCLSYIIAFSKHKSRYSIDDIDEDFDPESDYYPSPNLTGFPLLAYAARTWPYHSSLQQGEVDREITLLTSETVRWDWLLVHKPDLHYTHLGSSQLNYVWDGSGIYYASFLGLTKVVAHFITDGVNVNLLGGYYHNALHAATRECHGEVVEMLILAGADVNALDESVSALWIASDSGFAEIVELLIGGGAHIDVFGEGCSALQTASSEGFVEIVRALVKAGADINLQGDDPTTALQLAVSGRHHEVAMILLGAGADARASDWDRMNPIYAASSDNNSQLVQMLIGKGANVNEAVGAIGSALHVASMLGHEKVVQTLLQAGTDINALNPRHRTPLYIAASHDQEWTVRMLLQAGAHTGVSKEDLDAALKIDGHTGLGATMQMLVQGAAQSRTETEDQDTSSSAGSDDEGMLEDSYFLDG